jgi:hypothetical protein
VGGRRSSVGSSTEPEFASAFARLFLVLFFHQYLNPLFACICQTVCSDCTLPTYDTTGVPRRSTNGVFAK